MAYHSDSEKVLPHDKCPFRTLAEYQSWQSSVNDTFRAKGLLPWLQVPVLPPATTEDPLQNDAAMDTWKAERLDACQLVFDAVQKVDYLTAAVWPKGEPRLGSEPASVLWRDVKRYVNKAMQKRANELMRELLALTPWQFNGNARLFVNKYDEITNELQSVGTDFSDDVLAARLLRMLVDVDRHWVEQQIQDAKPGKLTYAQVRDRSYEQFQDNFKRSTLN